jgi:hypothetical protein
MRIIAERPPAGTLAIPHLRQRAATRPFIGFPNASYIRIPPSFLALDSFFGGI